LLIKACFELIFTRKPQKTPLLIPMPFQKHNVYMILLFYIVYTDVNKLKPTEQKVIFIVDRDWWKIVKAVASRRTCVTEDGENKPCTGSDMIREVLGEFLNEKDSTDKYPKILEEWKDLNINPRAIKLIEEQTSYSMLNEGYVRANTVPEEILKAHGWANSENAFVHPKDFTEAERQKHGYNKDEKGDS